MQRLQISPHSLPVIRYSNHGRESRRGKKKERGKILMKIVINQSQEDFPCASLYPISKLRTVTCAQVEPSRSESQREQGGGGGSVSFTRPHSRLYFTRCVIGCSWWGSCRRGAQVANITHHPDHGGKNGREGKGRKRKEMPTTRGEWETETLL